MAYPITSCKLTLPSLPLGFVVFTPLARALLDLTIGILYSCSLLKLKRAEAEMPTTITTWFRHSSIRLLPSKEWIKGFDVAHGKLSDEL